MTYIRKFRNLWDGVLKDNVVCQGGGGEFSGEQTLLTPFYSAHVKIIWLDIERKTTNSNMILSGFCAYLYAHSLQCKVLPTRFSECKPNKQCSLQRLQ